MGLDAFKKLANDDCVEAEIVSGPGAQKKPRAEAGRRHEPRHENPQDYAAPAPEPVNIPFYGLFLKIKFVFITGILLISFGLIVVGMLLTSTVIGAIIGLPMLAAGGFLLWTLFKLLTLGQKTSPATFRRF